MKKKKMKKFTINWKNQNLTTTTIACLLLEYSAIERKLITVVAVIAAVIVVVSVSTAIVVVNNVKSKAGNNFKIGKLLFHR